MTMTDVNAALQAAMGEGTSGPASWSWDVPEGTVREGDVIKAEMAQQTEYGTRKPLWWPNVPPGTKGVRPTVDFEAGMRPVQNIVVTLQTDERRDTEDDGVRRDFVKSNNFKDLGEALTKAGLKGLDPGCRYVRKLAGKDGQRKIYRWKIGAPSVSMQALVPETPVVEDELDF